MTTAGEEPGTELRALGRAGEQALHTIREATASGDGGAVSAIEAVFLLDDALQQLHGLQTAVPALLAAAEPGPKVDAEIKARADELAELAERVSATRREVERARDREQEVSLRLGELNALREQVNELRRRERLAAALQELNGQRQVIEQRLTLLRRLTEDQENALAASAGEVITLADERRALLAAHVRDRLTRAGQALQSLGQEEERAQAEQERLTDAEQRLAAAKQRHTELAAEREERLAQIAAHARADSALAAALSPASPASDPVGKLRAMLDGVVTQLDQVDATLQDTLITGQKEYDRQHAILSWADQ